MVEERTVGGQEAEVFVFVPVTPSHALPVGHKSSCATHHFAKHGHVHFLPVPIFILLPDLHIVVIIVISLSLITNGNGLQKIINILGP